MKHFLKNFKSFLLTIMIIAVILPQTVMAATSSTNETLSGVTNIEINEVTQMNLASSNVTTVYNFLVKELNLTPAAACGIMANIEHESSFNPKAKTSRSYGLCQWTGSRYTLLKKWCKKNGYNYKTIKGQMNYLKAELTGSRLLYDGKTIYNYLLSIENNANGAYKAASYWCKKYERPAKVNSRSHKRGNLSKNSYWPVYGDKTASITSIKTNSDGICITWKGSGKECDIYRSTDGLKFNKIGSSTDKTYTDSKSLRHGATYTYRIYSNGYYSTVSSYDYSKKAAK